jgi:hypothetical protein
MIYVSFNDYCIWKNHGSHFTIIQPIGHHQDPAVALKAQSPCSHKAAGRQRQQQSEMLLQSSCLLLFFSQAFQRNLHSARLFLARPVL